MRTDVSQPMKESLTYVYVTSFLLTETIRKCTKMIDIKWSQVYHSLYVPIIGDRGPTGCRPCHNEWYITAHSLINDHFGRFPPPILGDLRARGHRGRHVTSHKKTITDINQRSYKLHLTYWGRNKMADILQRIFQMLFLTRKYFRLIKNFLMFVS